MKKQSRKQTGKSLLASSGPPDHDTLDVDGIDHDMGDNRRFSGNKAAAAASKSKKKNTSKSKRKGRRWSVEEENKDEYCICRQGYDGNEFMIECDGCEEWFHGRCVGVKPKSVIETYFCDACVAKSKSKTKKSSTKQNTARRKTKKGGGGAGAEAATVEESIPTITISLSREDDEDLDDICPVCDTECICGTSTAAAAASVEVVEEKQHEEKPLYTSKRPTDVWHVIEKDAGESKVVERYGPVSDKANNSSKSRNKMTKHKKKKNKKSNFNKGKTTVIKHEISSDDDLDVGVDGNITIDEGVKKEEEEGNDDDDDDDDDEKASIGAESRTESYASSVHIDSGDDEGLEEEEERAIIEEMMENEHELDEVDGTDDQSGLEGDDDTDDDNSVEEYYYVDEDEDDDDEEAMHGYQFTVADPWSSSEDDDGEDGDDSSELYIEDDVESAISNEQLQSLLGDANLFDNIAAAFLQILAPLAESNGHDGNQSSSPADVLGGGGELDLSGLDLSALTAELNAMQSSDFHRRPSLPSSAVSAAQNHSAEDMTSERLGALSALSSDGALSLSLSTISEKPEEVTESSSRPNAAAAADMQSFSQAQQLLDLVQMATSRTTALDASNISFSAPTTPTEQIHPFLALEQSSGSSQHQERQSSHGTNGDKRRGSAPDTLHGGKKRRLSIAQHDKTSSSPSSSPAESEPTPVSMDELVDTSQLYTRSSSDVDEDEGDTRFSRDLSRWQRVPIGAFRLMRSKNKLWLER